MYDIESKEGAIRQIQRFLLELYYDTDTEFPVVINGTYDEATRSAVLRYQSQRGLERTGIVDRTTWDSLYRDYILALASRLSPDTIPPDTALPVTVGMQGNGVLSLQRLLNYLAERYGLAERSDTTGIYSYASTVVASAIQRIYRMPETGSVSGEFYAKMLRDYSYPQLPVIE